MFLDSSTCHSSSPVTMICNGIIDVLTIENKQLQNLQPHGDTNEKAVTFLVGGETVTDR